MRGRRLRNSHEFRAYDVPAVRSSPRTPPVNLGDALTALALIPQADEEPWTFDTRSKPAFAKLEFRDTSQGIAKAQRDNREGWWSHGQKNRAFIEEAAGHTSEKSWP